MSHLLEEIKETAVETLFEEELIAQGHHPKLAHFTLFFRNIAVTIAAILFILSICIPAARYALKATAYFCGCIAYMLELMLLTDFFKAKIPHNELFMVYCMGPLYLLLGVTYLFY